MLRLTFTRFFAPLLALVAAGSCAGQPVATGGAGGQGPTPQCVGTTAADDCAGHNFYACVSIRGCVESGACAGTSLACQAFPAPESCAEQTGCSWAMTSTCSGVPSQCFNLFSQAQCSAQKGCTWDAFNFFCGGTPTPCAQVDPSSCFQQQGCTTSATMGCTGASKGCDMLKNFVTCSAQAGCSWAGDCSGTPSACGDLPLQSCDTQPGCACQDCEGAIPPPPGGDVPCVLQADCDTVADPCLTGNCINGICARTPSCKPCMEQQDCNPLDDPCFTGNCINATCDKLPGCASCKSSNDCMMSADPCYTGTCENGTCGLVKACQGGDECCPASCTSANDGDC